MIFHDRGPYVLVQDTYSMFHEVLGPLELFLVPMASGADGTMAYLVAFC